MKVIEPPNKEKIEVIEFNQANNECKYCPCCNTHFYEKKSNITRKEYTVTKKHMLYIQTYKVMRYSCDSCGCKYESEPYNYEAYSIMDNEDSDVYISVFSILGMIISAMIALVGIAKSTIILLTIGCSLIMLIGVYLYLCFNYYKKYNKNKFKPYKVYKNIGDK